MEQFEFYCREIINGCDVALNLKETPNLEVIKIVKREFEQILDTLLKEGKITVLTKRKDLWAYRTIMDSAKLDHDLELFNKVRDFEKQCKKLPLKDLKILYLQ